MKRSEEGQLCDEVGDLLEPYLDGDLPPDEADRVRAHLADCPACAAELALADAIQRELRSLPQLDCPPEVLARVREAGRAEVVPLVPRLTRRQEAPRRRWLPAAVTGLAAALLLTIGGLTYRQLGHSVSSPAEPSPAEVARATEEARFALAYIGKVNRQAGLGLRDEVFEKRLVAPAAESVSRSLDALSEASGPSQEAHP
jgi:anti-sigma factor (TIGR02949 family)